MKIEVSGQPRNDFYFIVNYSLFVDIAEVAQLVEHNLAKVRVAGSSPVPGTRLIYDFRFTILDFRLKIERLAEYFAQVVKLVDTLL